MSTQPVPEMPNTSIKYMNKKSSVTTDSKTIHQRITVRDHIIDTYVNRANNPKNTDPKELHKYRYYSNFSSNHIYIPIESSEGLTSSTH